MQPEEVCVDGLYTLEVSCPCRAIVKGDAKVAAISAASILAKTARDAEMTALDARYPGYGFANHKGYSTPEHLAALQGARSVRDPSPQLRARAGAACRTTCRSDDEERHLARQRRLQGDGAARRERRRRRRKEGRLVLDGAHLRGGVPRFGPRRRGA